MKYKHLYTLQLTLITEKKRENKLQLIAQKLSYKTFTFCALFKECKF